MPTRAEVLASKIQQYDAQITDVQNADIDSVITKLATAQLASGTIGGGGGGGGGGGDASAANQVTGNISLFSINTKLPALGQATPAASTPVVLPTEQITALTPPTNTGYSTSALQTTINTSLGAINTGVTGVNAKLPAVLGQALVTTSLAVALPVTQITSLSTPTVNTAAGLTFLTDVPNGAVTVNTTSTTYTPTLGTAHLFVLSVSVITGTSVIYNVTVQESGGGGIWYDIYVFPTITTVATNYFSPPIMMAGRNYRYVETITGTTPSITRTIQRLQTNQNIPFNPIVTRLGGASITTSEFFTGNRMIRKLSLRNGGASPLFLQFHNSFPALTTGAVPVCGEIYSIPAGAGVVIDSATFSVSGQHYGANTRVALSTTQQTYTPVTVFAGISLSIEVNS